MNRHFEYSNYQISEIHTTPVYVPPRTKPLASANDNKICQWYCCSCGQSYGSIIYPNSVEEDVSRNLHPHKDTPNHGLPIATKYSNGTNGSYFNPSIHSSTSNHHTNSTSDYLLQNLKYYSQIVYSKGIDTPHRPDSALSGRSISEDTSFYRNYDIYSPSLSNVQTIDDEQENLSFKRSESLGDLLDGDAAISLRDEDYEDSTTVPSTATSTISSNTDSGSQFSESGQGSNIILNIPTRFTCHRCDHMMCPYCPKVRMRDLTK
ncbi:uncharacterized protein RJT20DRAFT_4272 [Scheffersomyces xylosifermentans]|uniref:uncharacterized protein n=1 Tax=Scheffersomyces xylosifermentans TaxID=1304137 RepID=UPI00315CD798